MSSKDSRFDKVFTDPRFMVAPKKVSKVKIDSRFQGMFKDKQFNVIAKVDKYGRKLNKKDNYALQNYYKASDNESGSQSNDEDVILERKQTEAKKGKSRVAKDSDSDEVGGKYYDEDGKFHWSGASSSSSDSEEEVARDKLKKKHAKTKKDSSDSDSAQEIEGSFNEDVDSATYSDDVSGVWSLKSDKQYESQLQQGSDVKGKRIAVKQLDWDSVSATDLLTLFRSLCKTSSMQVEKVEIYPSKFGMEHMERDSLLGPPKEMFEIKGKKSRKASRRESKKEYISDDDFQLDENDNGENMAQLRKYEVQKMDYYYAIVYCNSHKTALTLIAENQGMEVELTNLRLQLYVVPDELEFPYPAKQVSDEVPPNYTFDSSKMSRALNHTSVKLSWDQTDPKRLAKLQANYRSLLKKKENEMNISDEEEAYKDLIAGSSSNEDNDSLSEEEGGSESDDSQTKQQKKSRIEEMRRKLLSGITEDKHKHKQIKKSGNDAFPEGSEDLSQSDKEELQVDFGVGFGEDIGKKLIQRKHERREKERMTDFQKWQDKKKERRREKKKLAKDKVKQDKKQGKMSEKEVLEMNAEERRQKADLDLLVDDENDIGIVGDTGKRDLRFVRELDNDFAVDPTHKEYRKVIQGHNKISKRGRK